MHRPQQIALDLLRFRKSPITRESRLMTPWKGGKLISRPWRQWECDKEASSTLIHKILSWPWGWKTFFKHITSSKPRCLLLRVEEFSVAWNLKISRKQSRKEPRGCRGSLTSWINKLTSHTIWVSYLKRCCTDARWLGGRTSTCSRLVSSLLRNINYR
jgi:hypothetical protein